MHDSPIAMPTPYGYSSKDFTLEEYFKGLQKFHPIEDEQSHVKSQQIGGDHYQKGKIQPWDIFMDWGLDPWTANVIKYALRFPYKNGVEDLRKSRHYIEFLIKSHDEVKRRYYTKE